MPGGWKVGTIGDLCSTISKTYKSNDSHVILINTSDVENGIILNHDSVPNSNLKGQFKKTFQKGDILYSEIRPANKHYAFVDIDTTSNYIASTKLMVIRQNEDINPHYLYHILTNPDLIQEMQHLAETRSGTFPQITFESELSTYQIPLLSKEEQDKLSELFEKIDNQIFHNIKENKMLSTIRDTLLPKVMNGEIEV
jgi:type I restriction enzyme S subunit